MDAPFDCLIRAPSPLQLALRSAKSVVTNFIGEKEGEGARWITASGRSDDVKDALLKIPLSESTSARNNVAARLKRDGQGNEANLVKAIEKLSVSAYYYRQGNRSGGRLSGRLRHKRRHKLR